MAEASICGPAGATLFRKSGRRCVPIPPAPAAFAAMMDAEAKRWAEFVKSANLSI
jgi:hypothetical protein